METSTLRLFTLLPLTARKLQLLRTRHKTATAFGSMSILLSRILRLADCAYWHTQAIRDNNTKGGVKMFRLPKAPQCVNNRHHATHIEKQSSDTQIERHKSRLVWNGVQSCKKIHQTFSYFFLSFFGLVSALTYILRLYLCFCFYNRLFKPRPLQHGNLVTMVTSVGV